MLNALSDAVLVVGPDGRCLRANRAARALLNVPPPLVGEPVETLLGADAALAVTRASQDTATDGRPVTRRVGHVPFDGPVEVTATPLPHEAFQEASAEASAPRPAGHALVIQIRRDGAEASNESYMVADSTKADSTKRDSTKQADPAEPDATERQEPSPFSRPAQQQAAMLVRAEQRERDRLAQRLHDDVLQQLYGLQVQAALRARHAETPEELAEAAKPVLADAVETARSLAVRLSPPVLETDGLWETLQWLRSDFASNDGFEVKLRWDGTEERPSDGQRATLRSIVSREVRGVVVQAVRELLENAQEHAGVSSATVVLGIREAARGSTDAPAGALYVAVEDEGTGFDASAAQTPCVGAPPGGLQVTRQRLRLVGARLTVDSAPGQGTRAVIGGPGAMPDAEPTDDATGALATRSSTLPAWNLDSADAIEQQFREALQTLGIVVFRQNRDLRYVWICSPIPGFDPEDVLGKRDEDVMQHPEEAKAKVQAKREVMRTGEGVQHTFPITTEGTTRYFDYAIEPWHTPDGDVVGVTCAAVENQDAHET